MKDKNELNYYVVLVGPQIEGNIGAVARLCNNYAVKKLILIKPEADHWTDETRARAKHAVNYLDEIEIYSSINEIREKIDVLIASSAKAGKNYNVHRQPLYPWQLTGIVNSKAKIGLVFGREDKGLLNTELRKCDFLIHLPIPGEHKVMNLSHAVAVVLHEIWKLVSNVEERFQEKISSSIEREVLFEEAFSLIDNIEYEEHRKPIVKQTLKSIINRSFASHNEIHAIIGLLKAINRAIEEKKND